MTAAAVSDVSMDSCLPRISNVKLLVHKEPLPDTGEPFTSLPLMPKYTLQTPVRKRWREDGSIGFSSANSGYATHRNNLLACLPVLEQPDCLPVLEQPDCLPVLEQPDCLPVLEQPGRFKYDGCMFSKPLYQDLTMLQRSATSASRQLTRKPIWEIFPRNDTQRLSCHDTTGFIFGKARRDALYRFENPNNTDFLSCNRVYGPLLLVRGLQHRLRVRKSSNDCNGNTGLSSQTDKHGNDHEVHNTVLADVQGEECDCLKTSCRVCCYKAVDLSDAISSKDSQNDEEASRKDGTHTNRIEKYLMVDGSFGPWQEQVKKDEAVREDTLLANVHQLKVSSAIHCPQTHNELATNWDSRHYYLNHNKLSLDSWRSLCKAKTTGVNCGIGDSVYIRPAASDRSNGFTVCNITNDTEQLD